MAFSGTVSTTTFTTRQVIDHAYRRCRIPTQKISSEMLTIAKDCLYLILSDIANYRTPSWCIEKIILPMYINQVVVPCPVGTVETLNLNYRQLNQLTGTETVTSSTYQVEFSSATAVSTAGIKWLSASPASFSLQRSDDGITWVNLQTITTAYSSGEWSWFDISQPIGALYFRVTTGGTLSYEEIYLGNTPMEIPMSSLSRDSYVNQSNKVFQGRPVNYWFQRDINQPILNIWPAPNAAAEHAQIILWRHRYIDDVGSLTQELNIPQRWYDAIVTKLAASLVLESDGVDVNLIPLLQSLAQAAFDKAENGDTDHSPMMITPSIGVYTR